MLSFLEYFWKKQTDKNTKQTEIICVSWEIAGRMIENGWTIADNESKSRVLGTVYLKRRKCR